MKDYGYHYVIIFTIYRNSFRKFDSFYFGLLQEIGERWNAQVSDKSAVE